MQKFHEAMWFAPENEGNVRCHLCPNLCKITLNEKGRCNVRKNIGGKLYALNYGLSTPGSIDPIEKKPLYHFLPGSTSYSFGTIGCNLDCQFCQNWHISHASPEKASFGLKYLSPDVAVKEAIRSPCPSISYTYNEPFIWYEWVLDTSKFAKEKGLKNVLVTNGYIQPEPLKELLPFIDAANVDIKGDNNFYKDLCKITHFEVILETCEIMKKHNIHLEITNLLIPGKNDGEKQIKELAKYIVDKLGSNVPLHFSRYFPNYKLTIHPTPVQTLLDARKLALSSGINYVYIGNIHDGDYSNTYCKKCGALLIQRQGYYTEINNVTPDKKCAKCNSTLDILWE